ncbi:MAG: lysine--tRNA ligase [bacterium]|nr:lysine--tRNA ligase [bacterium]
MPQPIEELIKIRKEKLNKLKQLGINPNPPVYNRTHAIDKSKQLGLHVKIAGRVRSLRSHGKLTFFDLQDETGQIQVLATQSSLGQHQYQIIKLLDIGDFVGVEGDVFKTKAGEITVKAGEITFLSKALRPLPDSWYGLKDKEERFRKRYLDLILNPEAKQLLDKRWSTLQAIRQFLWSKDFKEVETPVLQTLYGGTNARPFITHINALNIDMYLRVAPELYLKRLIVGGYERIFEIARNFRNEGMDQTHQPEFTMIEFYIAYADYFKIMDITEDLIKFTAQKVNRTLKLTVGENKIDLTGKWRRITIDQALKEYAGLDWNTISDQEIKQLLKKHSINVPGVYSRDKALFVIYDHLVTPHLIEPTWVIDYPRDISPLSKEHRSKPNRVERFEGYIGGKEICDGWSEIVDPISQRQRFEVEQKNLKAGDDEAQPLDQDFLEALAHGCPPLGGIGIGIDRLVMFLTNTWSIREVIAFPLMKPRNKPQASEKSGKK